MKDKIIRLYYRAKDLSVRRFWENVGRWFSYFNVSRRIYDFDYSSILVVERNQISRVRDSIARQFQPEIRIALFLKLIFADCRIY